jgi:RHS repeat-associated protein
MKPGKPEGIVMTQIKRFSVFVFILVTLFSIISATVAYCDYKRVYLYYFAPQNTQCHYSYIVGYFQGYSDCGGDTTDYIYNGGVRESYYNVRAWCDTCKYCGGNKYCLGLSGAPFLGGCEPLDLNPASAHEVWDCAQSTLFTYSLALDLWFPEDLNFRSIFDEKECGKNIQCSCPYISNPINYLSGTKEEKNVDLEFPSPFEDGLKIVRTYNSRFPHSFSMGYGWKHNYDIKMKRALPENTRSIFIQMMADGYSFSENHVTIRVKHPLGVMPTTTRTTIVDFAYILGENFSWSYFLTEEDSLTHYLSPDDPDGHDNSDGNDGSYGRIVAAGDLWTWYRYDGSVYRFNSGGQLLSKTDRKGLIQTLSYNGDKLASVTDEATGRTIRFHYSGDQLDYISGPVTSSVPDGIWVRYGYDAAGNLSRVEYADDKNGSNSSGYQYEYTDSNDEHNLTAKYNLAGEFLSSWQYSNDRVIASTARDGKGVTISYESYYDRVKVTDANGAITYYYYNDIDGRRLLTSVTGNSGCASCGGDAVRYVYDSSKRVIEKELASGRIDRYSNYDNHNRYLTEIQAAGTPEERTIHYTLHPQTGERLSITEASVLGAGNKETIFDYDDDSNDLPNENPTQLMHRKIERGFTHDSAGAVTPYAYITQYTYTEKGQIASINGPLPGTQDLVRYTYDALTADLLSQTHPLTGTVTYTYDDAGNMQSVTDANGMTTTLTFDGRNRLLTTSSNDAMSSLTYTVAGEIATATDALDRTLIHQYNPAGFVEKIIDPSGNFIYHGYDSKGRNIQTSLHAPDNSQTFHSGTDWGNPRSNPDLKSGKPWKHLYRNSANTDDLATTYAYDAAGNISSITDANGNVASYCYDPFKRLTRVTQPGDAVTAYDYDSQDNLIGVIDAEGNITMYGYDDLGRLVETDSPDTGTTLYSYDEASNLRYKIQNGQSTEYRYDGESRLTRILYSDPSLNVTYTYDSGSGDNLIGRLSSMTDSSGTTSYSYDDEGNLVSETRTVSGISYTSSYDYDAAGNLRQIVYPTGQTIDYMSDSIDPARIGQVTLNSSQTLAATIAYLPFGSISSMTLGNGIVTTRTFDQSYCVQSISATPVMSRTYSTDNVGKITVITDNVDSARSQRFSYDANYRLTNATGKYGAIGYTYDAVGNRLTRSVNGVQDAYAYYPGTNRLRVITGAHPELFQYDIDGNTTRRIPGSANIQPLITDPADYVYVNSGQRTKKNNSDTVIYHYDQSAQLIAETTPAGSLIRAYVWLDGQLLSMIGANGSVYYFHNDHLGTPQKLTDSTGAIVWSADFLPFGEANVTVETVENNMRFPGQYFDSETGLHYNYWRYYDPKLGRYLRADPIGLAGGINPYSFTENNPVNLVDPDGESPFAFAATAIIAVYYVLHHHDIANAPEDPCANLYGSDGAAGIIGEGLFNIATVGLLSKLNWFAPKSVSHGPLNPGPLADDIANTFRSGTYTAKTVSKPTTMYRVISDAGNPTGSYWTRVKPIGPFQSVIDLALDQNWGNTATRIIKARIPAGTKIYEGFSAAQRGLVGGANQVYIPKINPKWIVP